MKVKRVFALLLAFVTSARSVRIEFPKRGFTAYFIGEERDCYYAEIGFSIPQNSTVTVWLPYCLRCSCEKTGSCSSLYMTPTQFPNSCKLIYIGCKPKVVKKQDEDVECHFFAAVG